MVAIHSTESLETEPEIERARARRSLGGKVLLFTILFLGLTAGVPIPSLFAKELHGANFSPYVRGLDPRNGPGFVSKELLHSLMTVVEPHTEWIRTFSSAGDLMAIGPIARSMGLKVACGAWLSSNENANNWEINNLVISAQTGYCDVAIVGSEVLFRAELSVDNLINLINRVRAAVPPGVLVTTADVSLPVLRALGKISATDVGRIISAVDVVYASIYPFWAGVPIDQAMDSLRGTYQELLNEADPRGKEVVISETGWPSCGEPFLGAVPSHANASRYLQEFVKWARANNVSYFYFEAFDERWKRDIEGDRGACWGIWDENGNLKYALPPPNGNGAHIELTVVPPIGSFDNLQGSFGGGNPANFKIAVYIKVQGRWWTKPTFQAPLTDIRPDGTWVTDITTGGVDEQATEIFACLLPTGVFPPRADGDPELPFDPNICVDAKRASRTP